MPGDLDVLAEVRALDDLIEALAKSGRIALPSAGRSAAYLDLEVSHGHRERVS
jgi:hypothetical protein